MAGQVYREGKITGKYDAIVIGSGIGGLTSAALLAKEGKRVLVLEKHYVAGGFTHTFKRKGYEWDVGIHYIGEVHRQNSILRRIFDDITNAELHWAPMPDVYDKVIIAGEPYDFHKGVQAFRDGLASHFPNELTAIDRYIDLVFQAARAAQGFFGERALPQWLGTFARPFMSRKFSKLASQTTYEVIASLTDNQKLLGVLTAQWGDYGLPPRDSSFAIHAMVAKHYFDGGNYPIGGSSQIAETIEPIIEESGGAIFVKAGVEKILIRGRKAIGVRLEGGEEILANIVISNAGVPNTFGKLLPGNLAVTQGLLKKLAVVKPSYGHVCLYLGLQKSAMDLDLGSANYWIYPDYDHDLNIKKYINDPANPLPVTYISFPSAKDPSWEARHPNTATIEILGFAPYSWFQQWENKPWRNRGDDYQKIKDEFSDRFLAELYNIYPHLDGQVDFSEISTPLSTRYFCNYERGEIYGLEHTPKRFQQTWLRPQTPIRNLFLTGQDIVSDGIGGALMAGVLTASAIMKKNLVKDIIART